jgi:transposase
MIMKKLKINFLPTRKKIIPLVMAIANIFIKELRFVETINEAVKWDRTHWNISPGSLAKMLVLATFTDIRIPFSHLEDRLENLDVEHFLEPEDKSNYVNESNVGEAMDRMGEIDYDRLYETMALTAVQQYKIPFTKAHSDTTTISFYGEYDTDKIELTEAEKAELLQIEKGYNKDGRPNSKQIVVGQIVNEMGIPIVNKTMDGSTSDIEWNREALQYMERLCAAGFDKGIYVADCKLMTEEHVRRMNAPETRVSFVSRCPANFHDKLESRVISKAYENGNWTEYGAFSSTKNAAKYKGMSFEEDVFGSKMRLIVLESDALLKKAEQSWAKRESGLQRIIKSATKKSWKCLADAEKELGYFLSVKELEMFECETKIEKQVAEKWPRGARSSKTQPELIETWHIRVESIIRREAAYQDFMHKESCFVIASNATKETSDEEIVKIYKGQQTVENSFRELKSPQLASVIYLKNQTRIKVLTMLLTFSLLLRALIQYRMREGLKDFNEKNPGEIICAGWGNRRLESPTYKLLYEHSVNCCFEREAWGEYSFSWLSSVQRQRVAPLLELMGLSLEMLVQ